MNTLSVLAYPCTDYLLANQVLDGFLEFHSRTRG